MTDQTEAASDEALAAVARAICEALGDDWHREGPDGLMTAYAHVAQAAIAAAAPRERWQPIETAPIGEYVLITTTGGHVGEALVPDPESYAPRWQWASGMPVHREHIPLGWMPLPPAAHEAETAEGEGGL